MSKKCPIMRRMKEKFEQRQTIYLLRGMPVIGRLDGIKFSSYTAELNDKFSHEFMEVMNETGIFLAKLIQGCQMLYIQSDEISVLLHDYKNLQSEAWRNYNLNKMISDSASEAGARFSLNSWKIWGDKTRKIENQRFAKFDSRFTNYSEKEVNNYFVARQRDCIKNSIQALGQTLFTHKELDRKNMSQVQDMCFEKGHNWNDLPVSYKRGRCIIKENYIQSNTKTGNPVIRSRWIVDNNIPDFSKDKNYIEQYLAVNY